MLDLSILNTCQLPVFTWRYVCAMCHPTWICHYQHRSSGRYFITCSNHQVCLHLAQTFTIWMKASSFAHNLLDMAWELLHFYMLQLTFCWVSFGCVHHSLEKGSSQGASMHLLFSKCSFQCWMGTAQVGIPLQEEPTISSASVPAGQVGELICSLPFFNVRVRGLHRVAPTFLQDRGNLRGFLTGTKLITHQGVLLLLDNFMVVSYLHREGAFSPLQSVPVSERFLCDIGILRFSLRSIIFSGNACHHNSENQVLWLYILAMTYLPGCGI